MTFLNPRSKFVQTLVETMDPNFQPGERVAIIDYETSEPVTAVTVLGRVPGQPGMYRAQHRDGQTPELHFSLLKRITNANRSVLGNKALGGRRRRASCRSRSRRNRRTTRRN